MATGALSSAPSSGRIAKEWRVERVPAGSGGGPSAMACRVLNDAVLALSPALLLSGDSELGGCFVDKTRVDCGAAAGAMDSSMAKKLACAERIDCTMLDSIHSGKEDLRNEFLGGAAFKSGFDKEFCQVLKEGARSISWFSSITTTGSWSASGPLDIRLVGGFD
eukprot:6846648-Pyramimonas_sp.AAC.2